jgi:hypothetical protein
MTAGNVKVLRDSASDALDQIQRAAAPMIKEGRRQAQTLTDQGSDLIDTASSQASEVAATVAEGLITYAKKNPLTALLLAVGAGALLISVSRVVQARR